MKIVVTLDHKFTPEQKARLDALGEVTYFIEPPKSGDEFLERVTGADIICSGASGLQDAYAELHDVYVTVSFVSVAFVDLEVLSANNVKISNAPGINRHAVAEWIFFTSLLIQRNFNHFLNQTEDMRANGKRPATTEGLAGANVTILGNGNVSKQAARLLEAADANITIFKRGDDLYKLVKEADIVIDALSSNPSTEKLLDEKFFKAMKPGSAFVTISRSEILDEDALIAALDSGHLSQAFSDCASILDGETSHPYYQKLLAHPKINVTPHIAFNSKMSYQLGNDVMIDNVEAWINGNPQNILNP